MSLVSALKRSLTNSIKTQGRSLLSMSGGVNNVMLARNMSNMSSIQLYEISPGRKIAYKKLIKGKKPTIVLVPGHHDKFLMDGPREMALMR